MFDNSVVISKDVVVVNRIPQEDIDHIIDIMFDERKKEELEFLGSGMYGKVFKIVGKDGFQYAVKQVRLERIDGNNDLASSRYKPHDANFLESLQGCEGFPTLFFYIEGIFEYGARRYRYMIMVSNCINGYTLGKVRDEVDKRTDFFQNMSNTFIDKLKDSLSSALKRGILPNDLHLNNIMFDLDTGNAVIIDTGCFYVQSNIRDNSNLIDPLEFYETKRCIKELESLVSDVNIIYLNKSEKMGA